MEIDKERLTKITGEAIAAFRKQKKVSQEALAYESGLARSFVSELERGVKQPTVSTLFIIGKSLEVRPSEIIKYIEDQLQ